MSGYEKVTKAGNGGTSGFALVYFSMPTSIMRLLYMKDPAAFGSLGTSQEICSRQLLLFCPPSILRFWDPWLKADCFHGCVSITEMLVFGHSGWIEASQWSKYIPSDDTSEPTITSCG